MSHNETKTVVTDTETNNLPQNLCLILDKALAGLDDENVTTPASFGHDIDNLSEDENILLRNFLQKEIEKLRIAEDEMQLHSRICHLEALNSELRHQWLKMVQNEAKQAVADVHQLVGKIGAMRNEASDLYEQIDSIDREGRELLDERAGTSPFLGGKLPPRGQS